MSSRLLKTHEVVDLLGYTPKGVREHAHTGLLPTPIRLGPRGHLRFDPAEVERFLATNLRGRTVDAARSSDPRSTEARRDPDTPTEGAAP